MTTTFIEHDEDLYKVTYLNLSILTIYKNTHPVLYKDLPVEVAEIIISRMYTTLTAKTENPFDRQ